MRLLYLSFLLLFLGAGLPARLLAQLTITPGAAALTVGGRVNVQYMRSSADGDNGAADAVDDVLIRRARISVDIKVGDVFDARVAPGFSGGEAVKLADVYARLNLARSFRVSAGQFKRAFSIFELSSSSDLPTIERDARIEGVSGCPGVGGVCTFSGLSKRLQFDARDLGLRAQGDLGTRVQYLATITNGEGKNTHDVNASKSASGRVVMALTDALRLAGFGGVHDYVGPDSATHHARAIGADVEVGTWREGFHLVAAVMAGDNWLVGTAAGFFSAQALASVYIPLRPGGWFAAVEPLLRAGWTTTEAAAGCDLPIISAACVEARAHRGTDYRALLFTPGISLYVAGKNWVGLNLDWYDTNQAGSYWSLKAQAFVYF